MNDPPKGRRSFLRYSIKMLLIITTVVAVFAACWTNVLATYWYQERVAARLIRLKAKVKYSAPVGTLGRLVEISGARDVIELDMSDLNISDLNDTTLVETVSAFPRLQILLLGGLSISDPELQTLPVPVSLKLLILDTTKCTDR